MEQWLFPSRVMDAVVTMEIKAWRKSQQHPCVSFCSRSRMSAGTLLGSWTWSQLSTRGRAIVYLGKAGGDKPSPVLQPCSWLSLGFLQKGPQKILKPFSRVRVGALRLLWARDDFTVTSLAWATAGISFKLTVERVLRVQLASPCRAVSGPWWDRALSSEMKRGRARGLFSSSRRTSRTASWKTCCTCSKSRQAETSKNRHPNLLASAAPSALVTCLVKRQGEAVSQARQVLPLASLCLGPTSHLHPSLSFLVSTMGQ